MVKHKIKEKTKEYKRDMQQNKDIFALTQKSLEKNIETDIENLENL